MQCLVSRLAWLALALLAVTLVSGLAAPTASAHERRKVAGDKAEVVVGWLVEPAYAEEPNGIDVRVTKAGTTDPIEGLEKTVKVEVIKGAAKQTYDLKSRFGMKGAYTADLIPTAIGDYTFRFFGEIEGAPINETFESGPGRFNPIQPQALTQFPAPLPSTAQLEAQVTAANAAADSARTLALVGIVVGIIGVGVGVAALLLRCSRGRPSTDPDA